MAANRGGHCEVGEGKIMRKIVSAADPDAYVHALDGWRRTCVEMLRGAVRKVARLEETVKWGHLVYAANGPALLIRAEDERVLLGFWRGQRLREIEPRLKPGGKYEMATFDIREGVTIKPAVVSRLARQAVALNKKVGDPTKAAAVRTKKGGARTKGLASTRRRQSKTAHEPCVVVGRALINCICSPIAD